MNFKEQTTTETPRAPRRSSRQSRDPNKRLKAIGFPIELCLKYERMAGVPSGYEPNFYQKIRVSELMLQVLEEGAKSVELTPADHRLIADEQEANMAGRPYHYPIPRTRFKLKLEKSLEPGTVFDRDGNVVRTSNTPNSKE